MRLEMACNGGETLRATIGQQDTREPLHVAERSAHDEDRLIGKIVRDAETRQERSVIEASCRPSNMAAYQARVSVRT